MIPRKVAVYSHRNSDGEIVYIGVASEVRGQKGVKRVYPRAFERGPRSRKKDHSQYLFDNDIEYEIEHEFEGLYSRQDALKKERELIRELRPRFNRAANPEFYAEEHEEEDNG